MRRASWCAWVTICLTSASISCAVSSLYGPALGRQWHVEEPVAPGRVEVHDADAIAHAPFGHHRSGQIGRALQVVLGAGRDLAERHLLGRPAAEQHRQLVHQVLLLHQIAVFGRQLHRVAERAEAARDDRDLVHRIHAGQGAGDNCVARLVVGDDLPLLLVDHALLLEPGDQPVDRLVEVAHVDGVLVAPGREERRLVHEVREIGAGEAGGARRDLREVDVRRQLDVLDVDAQHRLAALDVGLVHQHLPVEAAGTHQRRVEHLRAGSWRP